MVILEKPYISEEMKQYLEQSQEPVLRNETALEAKGYALNLFEDREFIDMCRRGQKIYTASENALDWIYRNLPDNPVITWINQTKDKVVFRKLLQPLHPDFFFIEVQMTELKELDFSTLRTPFVLKPSVGFFSVGVYTIYTQANWDDALADIEKNMNFRGDEYPDTVVAMSAFILEEYIEGEEYAIDAYFGEDREAVIVNIMKHDFVSETDVSDRLYYTGKEIIEMWLEPFTQFLNDVNRILGAKNFPVHMEVRVKDGLILPIECNPMRFAGWCTTDLTYFAFGFLTYEYYLQGIIPDWNKLLQDKDGKLFTMILLNKPADGPEAKSFDYDALAARFKKVIHLRRMDFTVFPLFGFLFTETDASQRGELDAVMRSDLTEYNN